MCVCVRVRVRARVCVLFLRKDLSFYVTPAGILLPLWYTERRQAHCFIALTGLELSMWTRLVVIMKPKLQAQTGLELSV